MIRYLLLSSFLILGSGAMAQDSLRVMVYNLLMYGNNFGGCTSSNNSVSDKDGYLKKIVHYAKPDIFGVNEMGSNVVYAERILDNVMNIDTIDYYERVTYTNEAGSSIVNMLYYDSRKLGIKREIVSENDLRDINIYSFYYKDARLATTNDTIFLTVVLSHLKAGSSSSDKAEREQMVQSAIGRLKGNDIIGNVLFMGDLNIQQSSEAAYQRLVNEPNPNFRFHDPINRSGNWNNNSAFADLHTQSTHSSSGCHSGGGMDDRFDQILSTTFALTDSMGMGYVDGSYTTLGQDGNRFNSSLISPTNNSAPDSVIQALYDMSDHLPVYLDLAVEGNWINGLQSGLGSSCGLEIQKGMIKNHQGISASLELIDLRGKVLLKETFDRPEYSVGDILKGFESGIYVVRVADLGSGCGKTVKILKR